MILYSQIDSIEEDTTEVTTEEDTENEIEISTSGDAYLIVSQSELNKAVETLPKIYDLFCFWFLMWLCFELFTRMRKQIQNHTGEMDERK